MGILRWMFGKGRRSDRVRTHERPKPLVLDDPILGQKSGPHGNAPSRPTYETLGREDEEKIGKIVRKLHRTMRQAGEQGLDEETIFDRALYEQMKADEKNLDRLLPSILIKLYELGKFTLTTSDRMDVAQFVRFFNERTGANVSI